MARPEARIFLPRPERLRFGHGQGQPHLEGAAARTDRGVGRQPVACRRLARQHAAQARDDAGPAQRRGRARAQRRAARRSVHEAAGRMGQSDGAGRAERLPQARRARVRRALSRGARVLPSRRAPEGRGGRAGGRQLRRLPVRRRGLVRDARRHRRPRGRDDREERWRHHARVQRRHFQHEAWLRPVRLRVPARHPVHGRSARLARRALVRRQRIERRYAPTSCGSRTLPRSRA